MPSRIEGEKDAQQKTEGETRNSIVGNQTSKTVTCKVCFSSRPATLRLPSIRHTSILSDRFHTKSSRQMRASEVQNPEQKTAQVREPQTLLQNVLLFPARNVENALHPKHIHKQSAKYYKRHASWSKRVLKQGSERILPARFASLSTSQHESALDSIHDRCKMQIATRHRKGGTQSKPHLQNVLLFPPRTV